MPLRNYRGGDGKLYVRWSLTGLEPIFSHLASKPLSRFQWHVVQWIEIENRAMQFLRTHDKGGDCFTIHSPGELNDEAKVAALLDFLRLPRRGRDIQLQGSKNRTLWMRTEITQRDREDFAAVVNLLPKSCLDIFQQPPYSQWGWAQDLRLAKN